MNARELADTVARRLGIPRKEAYILVQGFFRTIVEHCLTSPRVEIRGFGTFSFVRHKARPCRNFKTGRSIRSADRLVLKFKPSKILIRAIDKSRHSSSPGTK